MSYLKFDKNLMINLEQSLSRELIRTNKSGAYHSTTIVNCNTRKQHGLLVIPIPELDDSNHVLLSSLDETVLQHGAPFNLGVHNYGDNCFSPNGHKYIREYTCDEMPKTTYRVGGVVLTKEKVFVYHENRILIKYTLVEAHSATTLQFRPFLAFRSVNILTHENNQINGDIHPIENGISTSLYADYPQLCMQVNTKMEFVPEPNWYRGIEYSKERERGYEYKEDLYVPGYIQLAIKKGESIIFSAGITPTDTSKLEELYDAQFENHIFRNSFYNCLRNAAEQFYVRKSDGETYLLAGYPWYMVRARDLFIALPGCTLAMGRKSQFEAIMETSTPILRAFMERGQVSQKIKEIDVPDTLLWVLWAIQQYAKSTTLEECKEKYGTLVIDIIKYIQRGNHSNLFVHDNGLLFTNGHNAPVSWMNCAIDGRSVVHRSGYLVEFNALWYNALNFAASMLIAPEEVDLADKFVKQAIKTATSFKEMFLNPHGYLYDYVEGNYADYSVRPNMLFAISLDYSPLDRQERKKILDIVTRELLTPKGVRSLSPKSYGYSPFCMGTHRERYLAYHQGTAWPWLMGAYSEAYLKIFGMSGVAFLERMLIGFEDEMTDHGIGTISELYDGNPPFTGRGGISYAMNVAEVLRVLNLLKKYNQ